MNTTLCLFYEEPDPDRWVTFDRYPRRVIRRVFRGKPAIGGVKRWFLNLCEGLDAIHVSYTVNDYRSLKNSPEQPALVIGKQHVLDKIPKRNPIVLGPGLGSHPFDIAWEKYNIRKIICSCDWFQEMYKRDLPIDVPVENWPSGIQTQLWKPSISSNKKWVLIYDKIRWKRETYVPQILHPIIDRLEKSNIAYKVIRYGFYKEIDYWNQLRETAAMIFLCEHETQGFAYQQALSMGVPIFAWNRGGYWQDPSYYPEKVRFQEVSSVPYWDDRCGMKFKDLDEFQGRFNEFWQKVGAGHFAPRMYILENLTLEKCAQHYVDIVKPIYESSVPVSQSVW